MLESTETPTPTQETIAPLGRRTKFTIEMVVEESELIEARRLYALEHNGRNAPSDLVAIARDIQEFCYDIGNMHGEFEVISASKL